MPLSTFRRLGVPLIAVAVLAAVTTASRTPQSQSAQRADSLRGFTPAAAARERALEDELAQRLSRDSTGAFFKYFTDEPHPAGSVRNKELADFLVARFREYGLDEVRLHRYDVLLPWPREVKVAMIAPTRYDATLKEDAYPQDPHSAKEHGPTYIGMSGSGDVTGELVYASSGNPADYDWLESQGIDLKGKIALVRYSVPYSYRGFKALTAEQRGLKAMLVYSDPAQDGFVKGATFPDGPWGPASHIQRGAISYDFMIAGDPLTPGYASLPGAPRIKESDSPAVPKIIAVPLSYRDAEPLLRALGGPDAPESWQGALPFKYRVGAGPATVNVKVDMDGATRPIWVVEGRIRGTEEPDKYVVLGNHRDAWVFGAVDPSSGTATQLELARVLGAMAKEGKRPKRSIVFASWDAEEWHLTGSTEWGEHFADDLRRNAIAYLNVDGSTSGSAFDAGAIASLNALVSETVRDVKDPVAEGSVRDAWGRALATEQREAMIGGGAVRGTEAKRPIDYPGNALGSGSDYTVFLNFLGVPVVEMSFNGPYGVYHSAYDNYYWMTQFGDPGFKYMTAMGEVWGRMALRLANADHYPHDFGLYADRVGGFIDAMASQAIVGDRLDFTAARAARERWSAAATALERALATTLAAAPNASRAERLKAANEAMRVVEQRLLADEGIPGRPWFKHVLYAPRYTYAAMTLPGVQEAAESGDWTRARAQLAIVAARIEAAAAATLAASRAASAPYEEPLDARRDSVDMPAFVDHHVHLFNVGWWLLQDRFRLPNHLTVSGMRSEADVTRRVASAAARAPRPAWITGFGWNQEAWGTSALPTIEGLSAASPVVPVALARADGHALWVNRAALLAAGLPATGPGVLLERATEPVVARIPPPPDRDIAAAWRLGAEALAERGVLRVYDAGVLALPGVAALNTDFARYARLLAAADRERALPIEINLMIPAPSAFAEATLAMTAAARRLSPNVRITHLKLFADGALGSRGAALSHAYADDPHTTGVLRMNAPEIADWTRRALDAGLDVATHAIGDRAVAEVLDAYELVLKERPDLVSTRLRIEHFSYASDADFARAVRLGIALSMQSNFNTPRGTSPTFAQQRVGDARAGRVYASNRLERMGAVLLEGSDYFGQPGVPLRGVHAALVGVNALGERGDTPALRRRLLELNTAWLAPGGTLEFPRWSGDRSGGRVALSADPLTAPLDSLLVVEVRATERPRR